MASSYFEHFPTVDYEYSITNSTGQKYSKILPMRDLMVKQLIVQNIMKDRAAYYDYYWKDEDRPDTVAQKYYGSEDYYWVVLLSNSVYDPYYDFPIPHHIFDNYLIRKYEYMRKDAERWYKENILTQSEVSSQVFNTSFSDNVKGTLLDAKYLKKANPILLFLQTKFHHLEDDDFNMVGDTDPSGTRSISYYRFEQNENEERRKIKLLDRRYLNQFVSEAQGNMKKIAKQQQDLT